MIRKHGLIKLERSWSDEILSQEEIEKLQIEEAQSDKKPKKTAEQIQAIYSSGQNILVSASAGSGKPLSWLNEFLIN